MKANYCPACRKKNIQFVKENGIYIIYTCLDCGAEWRMPNGKEY